MIEEKEYEKALEIVAAYETELEKRENERAEAFRVELEEILKRDKFQGYREVEKVELRRNVVRHKGKKPIWHYEIFIDLIDDWIDEDYGAEHNDLIESLMLKHAVKARIYSGYYAK